MDSFFSKYLFAGSAVSIVSEIEYHNLLKLLQLRPIRIYLKTYPDEQLPLLGEIQVTVKYQTQELTLPLVVTLGEKPMLLCL